MKISSIKMARIYSQLKMRFLKEAHQLLMTHRLIKSMIVKLKFSMKYPYRGYLKTIHALKTSTTTG